MNLAHKGEVLWPEIEPASKIDCLLDELMEGEVEAEDLIGEYSLLRRKKKYMIEPNLESEMTDHHAYEMHASEITSQS